MSDVLNESPAALAISVTELNRRAKALLEKGLARLWVEGEVSNLARPASGHVYFTLKDESAQLRCAWFRQRQRGPSIGLKNGDQVLAFGRVSIYETRGEYQMVVEQLEEAGEGELRRQFEALKKKLAAEGLFADELKKALPPLPQRIGILTSPTGAAVRDILTVLRRRFPAVPVVVYPTAVQGDFATAQIVAAIENAGARGECDVLIVTRGGGSLEDLWQFNEEAVARAMAACPVPIVSAVGHEIDFTIADFVADVRAPTPSGAAEIVVPDQAEWQQQLSRHGTRIAALARRLLEDRYQQLDWLSRRLAQSSPAATVARQRDWLRNLQLVLAGAIRHELTTRERAVVALNTRLMQRSPAVVVQQSLHRLQTCSRRLDGAARRKLASLEQRLRLAARTLDSVSPLATLERGYSIVSDATTGKLLTRAQDTRPGALLKAKMSEGHILARVEEAVKKDDA